MGLLYMQTSPGKTERVKEFFFCAASSQIPSEWFELWEIDNFCQEFRDKLQKVIGDKHEDVLIQVQVKL